MQLFLNHCISSQDYVEVKFFSIKRKYMCLDKSKINKARSQNKEKVLTVFPPACFCSYRTWKFNNIKKKKN